jgi:hypothetical protein
MARGKYLSLEEARKLGKLGQFAREHEPSNEERHPQGSARFWGTLDRMARGEKPKSSEGDERT